MRMRVQSLAWLSGLRFWRCRELWCMSAATALIGPLAWDPLCAWVRPEKGKQIKSNQINIEKITLIYWIIAMKFKQSYVYWRNVLHVLIQKRQVTVYKDKNILWVCFCCLSWRLLLFAKRNNCFPVKGGRNGERNQLSLVFLQNLPHPLNPWIIK